MMNILEQIKEECQKHFDQPFLCEGCRLKKSPFCEVNDVMPYDWDIEEIEKRLSCDQLTTNLRLKCTLDCSNCGDKEKCDRRDDGETT